MPDLTDFWQDDPAGGTALRATNLNAREEAVYDAANAYADSVAASVTATALAPLLRARLYVVDATGVAATDTANVQAALTAAASEQKRVMLGHGTYLINTTLNIPAGVVLESRYHARWFFTGSGDPTPLTQLKAVSGVTGSLLRFNGTAVAHLGAGVENLVLHGGDVAGPVHGILLDGKVQDCLLRNVEIAQFSGNGVKGQTNGIGSPQALYAERVYAHHCDDCGIQMIGGADFQFAFCTGHSCAISGWWFNGTQHTELTNCTAEWNLFNGYDILGTSGGITFNNCRTDRNGNHGWKFAQTSKRPCSIIGGVSHRDGRSFSSAMVRLQGSAGNLVGPVIVDGLIGHTGKDDDGSGTLSPDYGLRASYASLCTWIGGVLAGALAGYNDAGNNTAGGIVRQNVVEAIGAEATPTQTFHGSGTIVVPPATGSAALDTANINQAIVDATAIKGTVLLSPSAVDYQSTGGHVIGIGVTFDLNNQYVKHTGNNTFLKITNTGAPDYKPRRSAVMNGWIKGNTGAAAIGVEVCDSWGALLRNLRIGSADSGADTYGGTAGIGLRIHNENASSWCEGTRLEDVFLIQNKIGLQYKRTSGTDSLAYHDYKNLAIAVGASQTGIDMGVAGDNLNLYNSFLDIRMWVQGASAILIDVGANFKVYGSTFAYIRGEAFGVTATAIKNRGGRFIPSGKVAFWRDAIVTDDRSAGKTLVDHLGIGRSYADTAVFPTLAGGSTASDVPDISHAGMGFVNQANEEYPVFWGYGGGGAGKRIASWAAKPFANDQGGATDTAANERMGLDADGLLNLMPAGAGIAIKEGTNGRSGLATLVAGTVTVSTTKVTANSRIYLSVQTAGGTQGFLRISARTAGTSFTITSTQATETSTVAWLIVEPAA